MTKEETKKAIEVMQAYVDGKQIQYNPDEEVWEDFNEGDTPLWAWDSIDYRIKPEKKVRPYTFDEMCEAVKKHGGYVISKNRTVLNHINVADIHGVFENYHTDSIYEYDKLLGNFVWLDDNSPCGIIEEE